MRKHEIKYVMLLPRASFTRKTPAALSRLEEKQKEAEKQVAFFRQRHPEIAKYWDMHNPS